VRGREAACIACRTTAKWGRPHDAWAQIVWLGSDPSYGSVEAASVPFCPSLLGLPPPRVQHPCSSCLPRCLRCKYPNGERETARPHQCRPAPTAHANLPAQLSQLSKHRDMSQSQSCYEVHLPSVRCRSMPRPTRAERARLAQPPCAFSYTYPGPRQSLQPCPSCTFLLFSAATCVLAITPYPE
jgi:hypothetical protein